MCKGRTKSAEILEAHRTDVVWQVSRVLRPEPPFVSRCPLCVAHLRDLRHPTHPGLYEGTSSFTGDIRCPSHRLIRRSRPTVRGPPEKTERNGISRLIYESDVPPVGHFVDVDDGAGCRKTSCLLVAQSCAGPSLHPSGARPVVWQEGKTETKEVEAKKGKRTLSVLISCIFFLTSNVCQILTLPLM